MTETSCAVDVRKAIDEAPIGRLPAIARALGVEMSIDSERTKSSELPGLVNSLKEAVDAMELAVKQPLSEGATRAELRQHLAAKTKALDKLDAALVAANGQGPTVAPQSVLDLCGYKKTETGSVICSRPETASLIEIFEMANAECARLGINPAVFAEDLDWWKKNTSAAQKLAVTEEVTGLVEGSLGEKRGAQEKLAQKQGGMASIEMAALANVLEHIATRGARDTFEGNWARTQGSGVALCRIAHGLYFVTHGDDVSNVNVGCAASRNLKAA